MVDDNQEGPSGQEGQQGQESAVEREARQLSESIARRLSEHLLRGPVTTVRGERFMGLGSYTGRTLALSWDGVSQRQVDFGALDDSAPDMTDLAQLEEQAPPAPAEPRYDIVMRSQYSLPEEQPASDPDDFDTPIPPIPEPDAIHDPSVGDSVSVMLYDRQTGKLMELRTSFYPGSASVNEGMLTTLSFAQETPISSPPYDTFIGGQLRQFRGSSFPQVPTPDVLAGLRTLDQALKNGGYDASQTQGAAFSEGRRDSFIENPNKAQALDTTDEKRAANAEEIANTAPSVNNMIQKAATVISSKVPEAVIAKKGIISSPYPQ